MITKIRLTLLSLFATVLLGIMLAVPTFTTAESNSGETFAFDGTTMNIAMGDCGGGGGTCGL